MNIANCRILLTGAAGGIGRCTAIELARRGATLALLDRDEAALADLVVDVEAHGVRAVPIVADLGDLEALDMVVDHALDALGGIDVLINNAGLLSFRPVEDETPAGLERLHRINVVAPMALAALIAPRLRDQGSGRIVNVGSIFGSIGFAYFAAYSASKFAMRGFSEALRRELAGSGVGVTYVAPRATRTHLADVFGRMAQATKMKLDEPEHVARRLADALAKDEADRYLGFPECVFVRLNALLPRLVDRALAGQDRKTRPFAEQAAAEAAVSARPTAPATLQAPTATEPVRSEV